MRTARSYRIIALSLPLAFAACSKDRGGDANSPDTAAYEREETPSLGAAPAANEPMTPASRVEESHGTTDATTPSKLNENLGAAPEATLPAPLNDAQIVALTDATNTAEVDAAKVALAHAKNARVRKFAQMMIDHHGKEKRDQAKLVTRLGITLEESAKLRDLRTSAADTDRTLKAAPDDMFDKVYVDIQVADHQMLLDALDRDFIPHAQNAELKKSLQDFRPTVERHLNQALELQKMLMSAPVPGSSPKSGGQTGASDEDTGGSQDIGSGSPNGAGPGTGGPNRK